MTNRRASRPAAALPIAVASVAAIAAAAGLACARHPARAHAVAISNFGFAPDTLTVAVGDTVVWTNADFVPHTATARDSLWDSQTIAGNGTWRLVARRPGRYAYYCVYHPNMHGTLVVR